MTDKKLVTSQEEQEEDKKKEVPPSVAEKLLKTRQIILSGEIKEDTAEDIISRLLILEAESRDPVTIYIDSPGGDVYAGFAIFDTIRFIDAPVYIVGAGLVASAAALVLLAVPKERRTGLPHSSYLIHQPSSGMRGVATDIEIHAAELAKTRARLNEIIAGQTGTPLDKVARDTERDYWLNPEEAVEYGLISRVIEKRGDLET